MKKHTSIACLSSLLVSSWTLAETQAITLNDQTSFVLENSVNYTIQLELDKPYSDINKACLTFEPNNDNLPDFPVAGVLFVGEASESAPLNTELAYPMAVSLGYQIFDPETGTIERVNSSIVVPEVCLGLTRDNLKDGFAEINLRVSGNDLAVDSLTLDVEGTSSDLLLSLYNRSETVFFTEEGGFVEFDATIGNFSEELGKQRYYAWSVVTMPDGTPYPAMKKRSFKLAKGDIKEFTNRRFKLPKWFPEGRYTLNWYVMDSTENKNINSAQIDFFKERSQ